MSEIQSEQLIAFTEANTKVAVVLEKLTTAMEAIAANRDNKEALARIEANQKDIQEFLEKGVGDTVQEKLDNSSMSRDMNHVKWFVGVAGAIIITVIIVLKLIGFGAPDKSQQLQVQLLQKLVQSQNNGGNIYTESSSKGTQ